MRLCKKARRARARFSECLVMFGFGVSGRMKDERAHPAEVLWCCVTPLSPSPARTYKSGILG